MAPGLGYLLYLYFGCSYIEKAPTHTVVMARASREDPGSMSRI